MADSSVPPPPKGADNAPSWAEDPKAKAEEKNWGDETALKGVKMKNDIRSLKVYGYIVPAMMVFFSVLFCLSLGVWAWHHLASYRWLEPDQLSKIQSIIFSGSLGAIVTAYAQKHLDRINK